mgnify:CR=1 FL=1
MSDKTFAQVQILAGFNGADGATAFTEESAAARTATFVGNAQLDTAQAKWGSASALFDGSGDRITFADAAGYTIGTSDFTSECWVRFAITPTIEIYTFISHYNPTSNQRAWFLGFNAGNLQFAHSSLGTAASVTDIQVAWAPVSGVWYHLAASRVGANLYIFIDGELITTNNIGVTSIFNSTSTFAVGSTGGGLNVHNGWIDDVRFTVGTGRYDADFIPPRGPFDRRKDLGVLNGYRQPVIALAA